MLGISSFFPMSQVVKNQPEMQTTWVRSLGWEDTLEEEMTTYSCILAGESQEQMSLAGYSPLGPKELDTTEHAY